MKALFRKSKVILCVMALVLTLAAAWALPLKSYAYTGGESAYAEAEGKTASGTIDADTQVIYRNIRDQSIPTGLIVAGWAGGAAIIIGAAAVLIVRHKKKSERLKDIE